MKTAATGIDPGAASTSVLMHWVARSSTSGSTYVVEADIKSFFDQVNHQWLVKFLRHRIGDERVMRLIIRMLKSGIMEDGLVTPQGIDPVAAAVKRLSALRTGSVVQSSGKMSGQGRSALLSIRRRFFGLF